VRDYTISADLMGGRYSPGQSVLHKINPTIKIWIGLLMILAVAFLELPVLGILMLFSIVCLMSAGLSLVHILLGLRHFAFFFLVLALFPALFLEGTPLAMPTYIPIQISVEGLVSGGTAVARFMVIVLISMLLTRTIHPLDLVKSMEKMTLKKCIGNGSLHDLFRVGILSMQVIPYLFSEVEKFAASNRQIWSNIKGINKYSRLIGLALPFLIHIFKSMDQLAEVIESE